jgi:ribonuclease VapC
MILDTSAIVAILLLEVGHEALLEKLRGAEAVFVGTPTALEAAIVVTSRMGRDARPMIAGFVRDINAEILDFTQHHYEIAVSGFMRFGKGRHPAALNFGDCMTYALAISTGLPILCTGKDFPRTDVLCA